MTGTPTSLKTSSKNFVDRQACRWLVGEERRNETSERENKVGGGKEDCNAGRGHRGSGDGRHGMGEAGQVCLESNRSAAGYLLPIPSQPLSLKPNSTPPPRAHLGDEALGPGHIQGRHIDIRLHNLLLRRLGHPQAGDLGGGAAGGRLLVKHLPAGV